MTTAATGGSRDRRIEDPTNLWIVHPAGRRLMPWFIARGISANAVSVCGLVLGVMAAAAYYRWTIWPFTLLGLVLSIGWLIADGLDGMIARATGTTSALGRFLDGFCDHGVFILIYVSIATQIGTVSGWVLAVTAGALHATQSNIYEGERARFHRRRDGLPAAIVVPGGNFLQRGYDHGSAWADRAARRFDEALGRSPVPQRMADAYVEAAVAPMHLMSLLSANVRVYAIFVACLLGNPKLFWWFEIILLTTILITGFAWHRSVETRILRLFAANEPTSFSPDPASTKDVTKQ
jgi:hypothetical protein